LSRFREHILKPGKSQDYTRAFLMEDRKLSITMKVTLLCIGKTDESFIKTGMENYLKRLRHYVHFDLSVIPDIKNAKHLTHEQQKIREGELILKQLHDGDFVVLVDERGQSFGSVEFAKYLEQQMIGSVEHIDIVIGGPYGFSY